MSICLEQLAREAKQAADAARKANLALETAKEAANEARRGPLKALVKRAHDCLCQWNHTDGCSWGYEETATDPWQAYAHARWLVHYDRLVNGTSNDKPRASLAEIEAVVAAVEVLKPKAPNALFLLRQGLTP